MAEASASHRAADRLAGLIGSQRHLAVLMGRVVETETGLTAQQAASLLAINDGAVRASDVAEQTHQHSSGVTRILDSLVGAGLVTRTPDAEDRRAVVLATTDEGATRAADVVRVYRDMVARILERMEDGPTFVDMYARFSEVAIEELGGPTAD